MSTQRNNSERPGNRMATILSSRPYPTAAAFAAATAAGVWIIEPAVAPLAVFVACFASATGMLQMIRPARPQWQDFRTGLLGGAALAELGDPLLLKTTRRGEPLSLLHFEFHDLTDVDALYGAAARNEMLGVIGRKLRRLAGGKGLALRTGRTSFVVLLPGVSRDRAMDLVDVRLGRSLSFELDSGSDDLVVVPSLSVVSSTGSTESVAQLLQQSQHGGFARRVEAHRPQPLMPTKPFIPTALAVASQVREPVFDLPDDPRALAALHNFPATIPHPLARSAHSVPGVTRAAALCVSRFS